MKYRLIKEYPGSPKLGTIKPKDTIISGITFFDREEVPDRDWIENYPEFWEEVIEKDYEILSFINSRGDIFTKKPNGMFSVDTSNYVLSEKSALQSNLTIHSVRRLSDGETFTIGDVCSPKDYNTSNSHPITKFELILKGTTLGVSSKNWYLGIDHIEKSKQSLFTTEDGVDIYAGDKYLVLNTKLKDWILKENTARDNINYFYKDKSYAKNTGIYYFSSKEKAEEYILMNKPCLSINDVKLYITFYSHNERSIKELVKSKIKQNEHC